MYLLVSTIKIPGFSPIPYPSALNGLDTKKFATMGSTLSAALPIIYIFSGLILLAFLIMGGLQFMLSQGDPKATQSAQTKMTSALVGFIIVFISYWVFQIAGLILGVDFFG